MEAVVDSDGRIVLPKRLRDALGLTPGTKVDISAYGGALHVIPGGRTARLERDEDGRLVTSHRQHAMVRIGRRGELLG